MSQKSHSPASSGEPAGDVDGGSKDPHVRAQGSFVPEVAKVPEEEAYVRIQKYAMNSRKTMREVAEAIILSSEMKRPK